MSRNVVISFADAIATIWNIVYDQNTSKKSVKLHKKQFLNYDLCFLWCFWRKTGKNTNTGAIYEYFVICSRFEGAIYEGAIHETLQYCTEICQNISKLFRNKGISWSWWWWMMMMPITLHDSIKFDPPRSCQNLSESSLSGKACTASPIRSKAEH